MNPAVPLQLRDIHLPDSVAWWPPAIGWWLLPVLIVIVVWLTFYTIKKIREPVLKKTARAEIEAVIVDYQQHQDRLKLMQDLSIALRRIGMSYLPRNAVAGEVGQAWYEQLNQLVASNQLSSDCIQLLSESVYQKKPHLSDQQVDSTLNQVRNWVAALSRDKAGV